MAVGVGVAGRGVEEGLGAGAGTEVGGGAGGVGEGCGGSGGGGGGTLVVLGDENDETVGIALAESGCLCSTLRYVSCVVVLQELEFDFCDCC